MLFKLFANALKSLFFNDKNKTFMNKYKSTISSLRNKNSNYDYCALSRIIGRGMTIEKIRSSNLFHTPKIMFLNGIFSNILLFL